VELAEFTLGMRISSAQIGDWQMRISDVQIGDWQMRIKMKKT